MIVFLLGGHGSGKSTAVRALMSEHDLSPVHADGRRHPLGYVDDTLFVVGHYEIPNGGADTVRPLEVLEKLVREQARRRHVVFEGVGQAGFAKVVYRLARRLDVTAILLTTSLARCCKSVRSRGHVLSADGVSRSWTRCRNAALELERGGVKVLRLSREEAKIKLMELTR